MASGLFMMPPDDALLFCAPGTAASLDGSVGSCSYLDADSMMPSNFCCRSADQFLLTDDLPSPAAAACCGAADPAHAGAPHAPAAPAPGHVPASPFDAQRLPVAPPRLSEVAGVQQHACMASQQSQHAEHYGQYLPLSFACQRTCYSEPDQFDNQHSMQTHASQQHYAACAPQQPPWQQLAAQQPQQWPPGASPLALSPAPLAVPAGGHQRRQLYELVLLDGATGRPLRRATEDDAQRVARLLQADDGVGAGACAAGCGAAGSGSGAAGSGGSAASAATAAPRGALPRALSFASDGAAAALREDEGEEVEAADPRGLAAAVAAAAAAAAAGLGQAAGPRPDEVAKPRQRGGGGGRGAARQQRPVAERRVGPCMHCGVQESPQWRKGPQSKPVVCNACGTRYRRTNSLGPAIPSTARPAAGGGGDGGSAPGGGAKRKAASPPGGSGGGGSKGAAKAAC